MRKSCTMCAHEKLLLDEGPCSSCVGFNNFTAAFPMGVVPKPESAFTTQVGGSHYKTMTIQPVEFALANKLDFFQKDIVKYITRRKGDKAKRLEDLNKAKHYLEMYIEAITNDSIE